MKKVVISAEEKALFREEIEKLVVKKLPTKVFPYNGVSSQKAIKKTKINTSVKMPENLKNAAIAIPLSDNYTKTLLQEESVCYFSEGSGLEPRVLKQIKSGEYPIDQTMDLHGDTIESARSRLVDYFQEAEATQVRFLLLVHGKGHHAKLKNHVIHWLKQIPLVLFFCSARPKDGGTGALYIFLKKRKVHPVATKSVALSSACALNNADIQELNVELTTIRNKIDLIDKSITDLLCQRFAYAKQIYKLKKIKDKDNQREENILNAVGQQAEKLCNTKKYVQQIYQKIFEQMREFQRDDV